MKLSAKGPVHGTLSVPGDKSISHRAVMLGSLAEGTTILHGFSSGADCHTTMEAFRAMGISIEEKGTDVTIHGKGLHGLSAPHETLNMGNSGTTTRLMSGILAAQPFSCTLSGDASLNSRPMNRIIRPLQLMGAEIDSLKGDGCAPLSITGTDLHAVHYDSPVASAQVKSCVLLAGLYADGETSVTEPFLSRDHTERMLPFFGADLRTEGTTVTVRPAAELHGGEITIPGDISTAAYYLTAALLIPGSEVTVRDVGINPTRDGILRVLLRMGAELRIENRQISGGEERADLTASFSHLHGTTIEASEIPSLIDEIPILAVAAALAEGDTLFCSVSELRAKESDRLSAITESLGAMGVSTDTPGDNLRIHGTDCLYGASIDTRGDHRIAMSFAIAALAAEGETTLNDTDCAAISCPDFFTALSSLQ